MSASWTSVKGSPTTQLHIVLCSPPSRRRTVNSGCRGGGLHPVALSRALAEKIKMILTNHPEVTLTIHLGASARTNIGANVSTLPSAFFCHLRQRFQSKLGASLCVNPQSNSKRNGTRHTCRKREGHTFTGAANRKGTCYTCHKPEGHMSHVPQTGRARVHVCHKQTAAKPLPLCRRPASQPSAFRPTHPGTKRQGRLRQSGSASGAPILARVNACPSNSYPYASQDALKSRHGHPAKNRFDRHVLHHDRHL